MKVEGVPDVGLAQHPLLAQVLSRHGMRGTMGFVSGPDDRAARLPANEVHISTGGASDRACEVGLVLRPGPHPVQ